jgi:predicted acetyltransferase
MGSKFFIKSSKGSDIKKLDVSYHKNINNVLRESFNAISVYDNERVHFGKMAVVSYLNVKPFLIIVDDKLFKVGGISSVATLPFFRGNGYATELLNYILDWMKEEKFDYAILKANNKKLYNKVGFEIIDYTEIKDFLVMVKKIKTNIPNVKNPENVDMWKNVISRF